ncbi:hypothetical protein PSTT_06964 [Puccinia striiformis]|uniref:Uncharacterized protein n=1 Tax=Puccinia striiformis TaxID=27350 RepID=A0A2S4VIB6_9BASI|nr:hypothetical protein PSTT_06964 [Puccinia striiformis]
MFNAYRADNTALMERMVKKCEDSLKSQRVKFSAGLELLKEYVLSAANKELQPIFVLANQTSSELIKQRREIDSMRKSCVGKASQLQDILPHSTIHQAQPEGHSQSITLFRLKKTSPRKATIKLMTSTRKATIKLITALCRNKWKKIPTHTIHILTNQVEMKNQTQLKTAMSNIQETNRQCLISLNRSIHHSTTLKLYCILHSITPN